MSGEGPQTSGYAIAAVERALALIETMARLGPASLAQIAAATGTTKTATFRLLRTLEAHGYAVQFGARGQWRLAAGWSAIGRAAEQQGATITAAQPAMAALASATGETVYLRGRDGGESEVLAIERVAGRSARTHATLGERRGLHAGPGLMLLAHAPPRLATVVSGDRGVELARIRDRGWLVNSEATPGGAVWLTVPVADRIGGVVLALSVAGPASRMAPPRPTELLTGLLGAANGITTALGGLASPTDGDG